MFTPKYPPADTAPAAASVPITAVPTPGPVVPALDHAPAPVPVPVSGRPVVQLTPGSTLALVAGGAGVVLVVGAVLVSMLLAVAVTAASVAVVSIVIRLLINDLHKGR